MKRIILIFLSFNFFISFAQEENVLTLWKCIDSAKHNLSVEDILKNNRQITMLQIDNISSTYLPVIKLQAQASYQSEAIEINLPIPNAPELNVPLAQYKAYLEVNQMLYDGGESKAYTNILQLDNIRYEQENIIKEKNIEGIVAGLYFSSLLLDNQEKILINTLQTLKKELKRVESAVKNKVISPVNRDILLSEILKAEQQLTQVQNAKSATLRGLAQYTGLSFSDSVKLIFPNIQISLKDTLNSPRINILNVNNEKLNLAQQQLTTLRRPKVMAFAQLGYGRPGLNLLNNEFSPYYLVGINFSWQIIDWNKTKRERQINSLKQRQLQIQKYDLETQINVHKEKLLSQIRALETTIKKDSQILSLQENIVKKYESQFQNGVITSSEYTEQLNKFTQVRLTAELHKIQLEQLKFEYNNIY